MKILSTSRYSLLAQQLATKLGVSLVRTSCTTFHDKELRLQVYESLAGDDVVIVGSTSQPVNDLLMEIFLLADAARRAGARRVIAAIPYLAYGRQDRPSYDFGPVSAEVVARLLTATGIDELITFDMHAAHAEEFFTIPVVHLYATDIFLPFFQDMHNQCVVSPDAGGIERAHRLADALGVESAHVNKHRDVSGQIHVSTLVGNVADKRCIIVDDIVDTAHTLCQAAELLMQYGAVSVEACVTHAVLSEGSVERVQASLLQRVLVTDSIVQEVVLPPKFQTISLVELLWRALARHV